MPEDRIEELLRKADAAAGPPAIRKDLVERVFARARRGRRLAVAACTGAALVVCTWAGLLVRARLPGRSDHARPVLAVGPAERAPSSARGDAVAPGAEMPTRPAPPDEGARLRAEIASLRAEADARMAALEAMLARARLREAQLRLERHVHPDPAQRIQEQVEWAALAMVHQADKMSDLPNMRESAHAIYRQAIELFPESHWAGVARQRLQN